MSEENLHELDPKESTLANLVGGMKRRRYQRRGCKVSGMLPETLMELQALDAEFDDVDEGEGHSSPSSSLQESFSSEKSEPYEAMAVARKQSVELSPKQKHSIPFTPPRKTRMSGMKRKRSTDDVTGMIDVVKQSLSSLSTA